jgi:hypothetical protein
MTDTVKSSMGNAYIPQPRCQEKESSHQFLIIGNDRVENKEYAVKQAELL